MQVHLVDAHLVRNHPYILSMAGALRSGLGHPAHDLSTASSSDAAPTLSIGGIMFVVKSPPAALPRRGHEKIKAVLDGGGTIPDLPEADGSMLVGCGSDQGCLVN